MIERLCLAQPQDEGCSQMEAMDELERVMRRTQTHWQPGNLIERILRVFLMLFSLSNCDDDKSLLMH